MNSLSLNDRYDNFASPLENIKMDEISILLVDDEEIIRKSFARELQMENFTVTTVASGSEAIDVLENQWYDLVITDLIMPDIDGFGVLEAAKKSTPLTSVIIFSGGGDMQSVIDALRLGADDFVCKPCETEEMVFRIRDCMEKRRLLFKAISDNSRYSTPGDYQNINRDASKCGM